VKNEMELKIMKMTPQQKKWISLALAILIVTLVSLLGHNKGDVEQKNKEEVKNSAPHQENSAVRKPGQSGFRSF
jgi:hypothetical protein